MLHRHHAPPAVAVVSSSLLRCDGRHGHPPYHPPPQDVSIKPAVARGAARRRHHSRSYRTSTRFAAAGRPPRLGVSPPHHTATTTTTAHRHLRRCEFDSPSRATNPAAWPARRIHAAAGGGIRRCRPLRQPAAGSRRLVVTRTTPAGFGDGAGAATTGSATTGVKTIEITHPSRGQKI